MHSLSQVAIVDGHDGGCLISEILKKKKLLVKDFNIVIDIQILRHTCTCNLQGIYIKRDLF